MMDLANTDTSRNTNAIDAGDAGHDGTIVPPPADERRAETAGRAETRSAAVRSVQGELDREAGDAERTVRRRVHTGAADALAAVYRAREALDRWRADEAREALRQAADAFEALDTGSAALVPVSVRRTVHDLVADSAAVMESVEQAEHALRYGEVQIARATLAGLASEIVVETTSLSLERLALAAREALGALERDADARDADARDGNDRAEDADAEHGTRVAAGAIDAALATLAVETRVAALPPWRARLLLERAEPLAASATRSEGDDARLRALIDAARGQVELAEVLGYGRRREEFRALYREIDELERRVSLRRSGLGLLDALRERLAHLFDRDPRDGGRDGGAA